MRARIIESKQIAIVSIARGKLHLTHDWQEIAPEHEAQVQNHPYLEIEQEAPKRQRKQKEAE